MTFNFTDDKTLTANNNHQADYSFGIKMKDTQY